ncbi:MAG: GNAT family N-acetyltransferase [Bacillota bacterium]
MTKETTFSPLTPDRWADCERLFGPRGACAGCWCMWWRLPRSEFGRMKGEGNRLAFKAIVDSGEVPGIIAYDGGEPVGWCSVAPRESFSALERARKLKRLDDRPVWSVVCFFVAKGHRRQGLTVRLLEAAADYAGAQGARLLEGYPVDPDGDYPDAFAFTGLAGAFRQAGFVEVARPSARQRIMRRELGEPNQASADSTSGK